MSEIPASHESNEEVRQAITSSLEKIHAAFADLSWALHEAQQFTTLPEQMPEYRRAMVMYQAIDQAEKFEI